tara:strand:- start:229 stop:369 length:141 start_codon:yes stop_codon:yes gene_type:complete
MVTVEVAPAEVVPEEPIQELAVVEDMVATVIVEDLALLLYHIQEIK